LPDPGVQQFDHLDDPLGALLRTAFRRTRVKPPLAGYAVELIFGGLHLVPGQRNARVIEAHVSWNYTTWLNLAFLAVAAVLLVRFVTSGGLPMLRMMGGSPRRRSPRRPRRRPQRPRRRA
jgi:hypothetical protein